LIGAGIGYVLYRFAHHWFAWVVGEGYACSYSAYVWAAAINPDHALRRKPRWLLAIAATGFVLTLAFAVFAARG
jgi:hypothetical protein